MLFLIIRPPPRSTRTHTLLPYTPLFRPLLDEPLGKRAFLHRRRQRRHLQFERHLNIAPPARRYRVREGRVRSEEHTSELQSLMRLSYAVFCLKKKDYYSVTKEDTAHYANTTSKGKQDTRSNRTNPP